MESKQTAIEWLVEKIEQANPSFKFDALIRQAKEMEKEQMFEYIKNIYVIGENSSKFHQEEFEKYYNETFNKDKQ